MAEDQADNRPPINGFTVASVACQVGRLGQFSLATCAYIGSVVDAEYIPDFKNQKKTDRRILREQKKLDRKRLKAEAKAQDLLKKIIGIDQWRIYRKTDRVILKPQKHFWIIGNYFGRLNKAKPFFGKPDVIRIDNNKKLHITEFCVDQAGGENTPFTDKVVFFASHLISNEKEFIKTINRTGEKTLKTIKESAIWNA
jgi:hypothetical protein